MKPHQLALLLVTGCILVGGVSAQVPVTPAPDQNALLGTQDRRNSGSVPQPVTSWTPLPLATWSSHTRGSATMRSAAVIVGLLFATTVQAQA